MGRLLRLHDFAEDCAVAHHNGIASITALHVQVQYRESCTAFDQLREWLSRIHHTQDR